MINNNGHVETRPRRDAINRVSTTATRRGDDGVNDGNRDGMRDGMWDANVETGCAPSLHALAPFQRHTVPFQHASAPPIENMGIAGQARNDGMRGGMRDGMRDANVETGRAPSLHPSAPSPRSGLLRYARNDDTHVTRNT